MPIIFSEASGVNDSIFGKAQAPIRMFLEKRGEAFEKESALKYLFHMGTSDNYGDMYTGMSSMDDFEAVGENGAYPSATMEEGYQKHLIYMTWKNSFNVSAEIMEDGKLMDLRKKPAAFITSFHRTREKFGAALYGAALNGDKTIVFHKGNFDTTCADKEPLFSTVHPEKFTENKQSNMFSDEFSVAALDAAESHMHTVCDDKGEVLDVSPDTIVIPDLPTLKRKVLEVIGSDENPETAGNAYNHQYGRWNLIVWPYLNRYITQGKEPWILIDSEFNELYDGAPWNDRIPLKVRSELKGNDSNAWLGRARFKACFNDWRFACAGGLAGGTKLVAGK